MSELARTRIKAEDRERFDAALSALDENAGSRTTAATLNRLLTTYKAASLNYYIEAESIVDNATRYWTIVVALRGLWFECDPVLTEGVWRDLREDLRERRNEIDNIIEVFEDHIRTLREVRRRLPRNLRREIDLQIELLRFDLRFFRNAEEGLGGAIRQLDEFLADMAGP